MSRLSGSWFDSDHRQKINLHLRGKQSTDFRAYRVDLFTGSMHLLTTVSRRRYCPDFRPAGDFLVINTRQGSDFVVVVRKIPLSADTTEEEAVLNLGPGLVRYH
jgi:hypothetical protein